MRILVSEYPCSFCSDTNRRFIVHVGNGKFVWDYDGCGGYEGRQCKIKDEPVDVEEVLNLMRERKEFLEARIDEDKSSAREIKHAIQDITCLQKENGYE